MTRWYPLEAADASFLTSAPLVYRYPIRLAVPPERVWESLASDRSLADWGLGLQRLTWTTLRPFGIGTTREVVLPLRSMTVREEFFRWDEGSGYSFFVRESNRPMFTRFAEDYVVEAAGSGSLFTWTIALEPRRGVAPLMKLLSPVNRASFGQFARGAKSYFAKHP